MHTSMALSLGRLSIPQHGSFTSSLPAHASSTPLFRIHADVSTPSRTKRIIESIPASIEAGGAGGASSYLALKRLDEQWRKICDPNPTCSFRLVKSLSKLRPADIVLILSISSVVGPPPNVVVRIAGPCPEKTLNKKSIVFDVAVCGGTLGIFIATALAIKGFRVAVVERGKLQGRVQEWNISRKELQALLHLGLLTASEIEEVIAIEFNPNRCGFKEGTELWVTDILNLGVSPSRLIETVKEKFLQKGGVVLEGAGLSKAEIFDDLAVLNLDGEQTLLSRLVIDAMGSSSPIVRQIRWGESPDGACLVVGTCARGFNNNSTSDVIYSNSPVVNLGRSKIQYFWEAFPSGSGPKDRTSYLFTYLNPNPTCPSLEQMLEDYWDLMPAYQDVKLEDMEILRALFGFFVTYKTSPLPSKYDRVLQVGDASGIQSPISFGGFGSLTRHVERLTAGISEALEENILGRESLALINPYMPNLSGSWLFQRAMSVRPESNVSPDFINELLAINFQCMQNLGDPVLRPFLQDVIQFVPLAKTLGSIVLRKPGIVPSIFRQVGLWLILDWLVHFGALGGYTLLYSVLAQPILSWSQNLPKKDQFVWKRRVDAWKYGSGLDYEL